MWMMDEMIRNTEILLNDMAALVAKDPKKIDDIRNTALKSEVKRLSRRAYVNTQQTAQ